MSGCCCHALLLVAIFGRSCQGDRLRGTRPSCVSGGPDKIRSDHESDWAAMTQVATLLGVGTPEVDGGARS